MERPSDSRELGVRVVDPVVEPLDEKVVQSMYLGMTARDEVIVHGGTLSVQRRGTRWVVPDAPGKAQRARPASQPPEIGWGRPGRPTNAGNPAASSALRTGTTVVRLAR